MTAAVLDIARGYRAAGLSLIPIRPNGRKMPAIDEGWRAYSESPPTDAVMSGWWTDDTYFGIGVTGGPASGNLAVLDFETAAAWQLWFRSLAPDWQEFVRSMPLAYTPRGGSHLYCRLPESVPGVGLAYHRPDPLDLDKHTGLPRVKTLIEVRGNGQYVLAPGCPPECHPTGKLYEWLRPPPPDGHTWSNDRTWEPLPLDVWFAWLELAEALDEVPRSPQAPLPDTRDRSVRRPGHLFPGDDFNVRGTWAETGLFAAGWVLHRDLGDDRGFVRRPGKSASQGQSGTVGLVTNREHGVPLFYPFTTSAHPFEPREGYSRWRVYAILQHRSHFYAAAKALAAKGYGEPTRGKVTSVSASGSSPPPPHAGRELAPPSAPGVKPPLPLVYYADVAAALDAADFVEGLLIDGAMSVIYGESGCGKTFFALDLALHVAAGRSWRGRDVDCRGVLYLALEGSHGIRNRISAFKIDQLANAVDLPLAVVPVSLDLLAPTGDTLRVVEAAQIAADRLTVPVGLIVVDTLSRALAGGNENSPEDMGALVRNVDLIRQALPSHVSVIHHSGKDAARGARGHSLLRAATDTEIEVSREPGAKVSMARVTKQRELELGAEFPFRLLPIELGKDRRGKPVTSCVVRDADSPLVASPDLKRIQKDQQAKKLEREQNGEDEKDVLAVIKAEIATGQPGASRSWIEDQSQCSARRAFAAVCRLCERGELVQVPPFKKASGKGAGTLVKEGFGLPTMSAPSSE